MYHVAFPITAAMAMIQAGDSYFKNDEQAHTKRMMDLQGKGMKYYTLCPNINKEGMCGCKEAE